MNTCYPALFYFDTESDSYFVTFPDFENSATQGDTIAEALAMASEYLGITLADYIEREDKVPNSSNINHLSLKENYPFKNDSDIDDNLYDFDKSFISMVSTDVTQYLNQDKPVKKTLTIPLWADTLGKKLNLNFSKTLTEAIANKHLGV
ncbi:hypothetical protein CYJ27_02375 [Aerococcus christensenii]|uniref:HicB-like antitoxin of toxin-antitoxin system domain-containing protein n=1 Tax=Aerococcus christensenii TaxID=87541 RepID=A0A2I1K7D4_9LACT|nr:type II toxin-antitoxin system HicB family antitoxin [Aerococcus christensenii]PKY91541.1 hypothetical protein CYJ27_02375 [Aerococcus christensenii]